MNRIRVFAQWIIYLYLGFAPVFIIALFILDICRPSCIKNPELLDKLLFALIGVWIGIKLSPIRTKNVKKDK
ncbi:MAG: hypothetical protein ACTSQE_12365 [Candidatus Heimdallarchaeaceae archaeon]